MKTFYNLLGLLVAVTAFVLIFAQFADLAVMPEWLDDLLNIYVGYSLAHLFVKWRGGRAEQRKATV